MSDRIDPKAFLPHEFQMNSVVQVKIKFKPYTKPGTTEIRSQFIARYKEYKIVIDKPRDPEIVLSDGETWIVEPLRTAPGLHVIFCEAVLRLRKKDGIPVPFDDMPRRAIQRGLKERKHADVFDIHLGQKDDGGSNPIYWYDFFEDYDTGEVYWVQCWDGERSCKSAHSWEDHEWLSRDCYHAIVERCHLQAAEPGRTEIRISGHERAIMQGFTHSVWLETTGGAHDGEQSKEGLKGGLVGHCHGIPVICDRSQKDNLPPRSLVD